MEEAIRSWRRKSAHHFLLARELRLSRRKADRRAEKGKAVVGGLQIAHGVMLESNECGGSA